jgi:hypothetical protein
LGLAFAGHALFESITHLADSHVLRQWRRYVTARMSKAAELRNRLGDADRAKTLLANSLAEVQNTFSTTKGLAGSSLTVIEEAKNSFLEQIKLAEQIRLDDGRKLDRGAMLRQFLEYLVVATAAVLAIAMIAVVYTFVPSARALSWLSGRSFGWTVAICQAAVLLVGGSAASRSNTTLAAAPGIPGINPGHGMLATFAGVAILVTTMIANGFHALHAITTFNVMLWALLAAADICLFWSGMRLGLIVAAVWALLCSAARAAASLAAAAGATILWIAGLALRLASVFATALAYPYSVLFRSDRPGAQMLSSVSKAST